MVQRAVQRQVCRACGARKPNKAEMDEHIKEFHSGDEDPVVWLFRAKDQREFRPSLSTTPWGKEFR